MCAVTEIVTPACAAFSEAGPQQKRAWSATLVTLTWKAGKSESSWKTPFDKMALSNSVSQTKESEKSGSGLDFEIWLPVVDAFRTLVDCPPSAIRLLFVQIQQLAGC